MTEVRDFTALLSGFTLTGAIGRSAFVTYSFATAAPQYLQTQFSAAALATFEPLNASAQALAREAVNAWAFASGVTAFEAAPGQGDINLYAFDLAALGKPEAAAFAFYPFEYQSAAEHMLGSDVFFDLPLARAATDRYTFFHEIGHALGLKHPFEDDPILARDLDTVSNTVMSYTNPAAFAGQLGPFDLQAIRHLYGPDSADGTQVAGHSWDASARRLLQEGDTRADLILGVAAPDVINGLDGADTILARAGDDRISGGNGQDVLDGELGDDTIDGGADNDILSGGELVDSVFLARLIAERGLDGGFRVEPGLQPVDRYGLSDNDMLFGGSGDDVLIGGWGRNLVDGGEGTDVLLLLRPLEDYGVVNFGGQVTLFASGERQVTTSVERAFSTTSSRLISTADVALFDALRYIAGNSDLSAVFGTNGAAGAEHYIAAGFFEGRNPLAFDPLRYIASNGDLIAAFGADAGRGSAHYITNGRAEGRSVLAFDPLEYIAGYGDLIRALGLNADAGSRHFILNGVFEGRRTDIFDALRYGASYPDLQTAFGLDTAGLTRHWVGNGFLEGRNPLLFDSLRYIASYPDLIRAFGANGDAGAQHWITNGRAEVRNPLLFDPLAYAAANSDLQAAFGTNTTALTLHYLNFGFAEGRSTGAPGSTILADQII